VWWFGCIRALTCVHVFGGVRGAHEGVTCDQHEGVTCDQHEGVTCDQHRGTQRAHLPQHNAFRYWDLGGRGGGGGSHQGFTLAQRVWRVLLHVGAQTPVLAQGAMHIHVHTAAPPLHCCAAAYTALLTYTRLHCCDAVCVLLHLVAPAVTTSTLLLC
jgi:hypothetical protein